MEGRAQYLEEPARKTPVRADVDVLVAGGGLSGVMAAVAAARSGAKVLLAERYANLGGVASMGLPIQGYCGCDGTRIVAGLADELRNRLIEAGGADREFIPCAMHNAYMPVLPEKVKLVCQQMLLEEGVEVLLGAPVVGVAMRGGAVQAAFIEGKSGREAAVARYFVDCTGDADMVVRAGFPCNLAEPHALQASTLNMIVGRVDTQAIRRAVANDPDTYQLFPMLSKEQFMHNERYILVGMENLMRQAGALERYSGLWENLCYLTIPQEGYVCINTVHVSGKSGCDTRQLSHIELEGRAQAEVVFDFLQHFIPGFENAVLTGTGPWAGIRETRTIRGLKTLTLEQIEAGVIPDDTIALGGYPYDFHGEQKENGLCFVRVPVYGIPFGCLIPEGADNLLVAGRTISATRAAMASSRVMAQCMAEGEAAGVAAAHGAQFGLRAGEIDVGQLRAALRARGALVDAAIA